MTALQAIGLLALVVLAVGVLWAIRPGASVRATRRSIRLGFPLALGIMLAPPMPELKPCPWGCPTISSDVRGTSFHASCFRKPESEVMPCLVEVDMVLERLKLRGEASE